MSSRVLLRATLFAGALAGSAHDAVAQRAAPDAASLRARFQTFDINPDGRLDGIEVTACGCMAFDRNGDREITWEEYRDGTASAARGGRTGMPPAPARTTDAYRIPDRVEVRVDGTWFVGSVYAVRNGAFKVLRDGYTSDDRWFTPADLRPYTPPARPAAPRTASLPGTVPLGTYDCSSYSSGVRMGFGQLRITGAGTYTGISRDAAGAPGRFAYDPASGAITWAGGKLLGFVGMVTGSSFGYDTQRTAMISVSYVARAGANGFDMSCSKQ